MDSIIANMKRIATQKNGFWKRVVINIPFILMIALMIVLFGGGALLWFYAIASCFAFKSGMVFLIVAGAGTIAIGIGLGFIEIYKKYYDFYNKKMGWEFPDAPKPEEEEKTIVSDGKKPLTEYFTLSNIAIGVLAVGAVFTIISAALGCISRDKWVDATSTFMRSYGYYDSVKHQQISYILPNQLADDEDVPYIEFVLTDKNAVIVYSEEQKSNTLTFDYYAKYEKQVISSQYGKTYTIVETAEPSENDTLKKLFFFLFKDLEVVRQITVTLPEGYRVKVVGNNYVFAKTDSAETPVEEPAQNQ